MADKQLRDFFEDATPTTGPYVGQKVTVSYTLVAAAASAPEEITGEISMVSGNKFTVDVDGSSFHVRQYRDGLHVFRFDGRLGPVTDLEVH